MIAVEHVVDEDDAIARGVERDVAALARDHVQVALYPLGAKRTWRLCRLRVHRPRALQHEDGDEETKERRSAHARGIYPTSGLETVRVVRTVRTARAGSAACRGSACRSDRPRSCWAWCRRAFSVSIRIGKWLNRAIVQQTPERLEPETALADVLVPIDAAAARPLRIVPVKDLQPIEADEAIEGFEGVAIASRPTRCRSRRRRDDRYRDTHRRAPSHSRAR